MRAYYRNEIPGEAALVQAALDAADSGIHEICQRKFFVASTGSERTYVPERYSSVLRIHDCTTVTSVMENGTAVTVGTGYLKEPVQTISWSGEARPYEQLRRLLSPWYSYLGTGTVVVTATWGWLAIPPNVKQAAYIGAKELLDSREVKFGIAAISEFGPMRVRENPQVNKLVHPYRRQEAFGLA